MTDENKKMLLEAGIDFDGIATRIPFKDAAEISKRNQLCRA